MTPDSIPPTLLAASETDEPQLISSSPAGSPGRMIRAARERARLSLEELANQTKLARSTLDALERDDFAALNEAVYVRGYYRKCAKVLVLSESDLLSAYGKLVVPKAPQMPTKLLIGSGPAIGRPSLRRRGNAGRSIAILIGVVVIAGLAWSLLNEPSKLQALGAAAPTATAVQPAAVEAAPALPPPLAESVPASEPATLESAPPSDASSPATGASTPAASTPTAAPVELKLSTSSSAAASAPPAAPAPAQAPITLTAATGTSAAASTAVPAATSGAGALNLNFKATSWVRIEDADGKVLLSGVVQAGDHQTLRGRLPYSLFIGNAPGVAVELDGKPVDTAAFVKGNSTARFTLP